MKRSTARWTSAVAAAVLLGLPATGWPQSTPAKPSESPTSQQAAQHAGHEQHGAALEHLQKAKAALGDVQPASVPARAKNKIAELKRHLNALEKSVTAASTTATTGARGKSSWATHVAAVDKTLNELIGSSTGAPSAESTPPAGSPAGTTGSRQAPAMLDEATKAKLMEVRTHVTAFASAMSGSKAPDASAPSTDPAEQPQSPAPAPQQSPSSQSSPSVPPSSSASAPSSTQPQSSAATGPAAQSPAGEPSQAAAPTAPQVNEQEAKQHLTAARDSLSQLTQLPAAAQLTGEARTQVAQLITNFNELITTSTDWRSAYAKVEGNLTALLGPESADPAQAQTQAPTPAPTTGAVGTTGSATMNLDPAVKGKLIEFRSHLSQFEKAAGGGTSSSAQRTPGAAASPGSPTSGTPGATGTTGSSSSPSPTTGGPATGTPGATGTTGSSTSTPSAAPTPSTTAEQSASTTSQPPTSSAPDHQAALRHIEAIEAIIGGGSSSGSSASTPGATGTTGATPSGATPAAGITLDRTKVEQIRMHLAELRKGVEKANEKK